MSSKIIRELLADSSLLHALMRKALPDDTIDRADIERRLELLWRLDDPRLGLERLAKQVHGELSSEHQEALAKQQSLVGEHTIYSIVARHHRVEPYEADWKGKGCQSVRVTLPQSKDSAQDIWTHVGVVKPGDHLLFSIDETVAHYQNAFGRAPTVGRVDLITGARHLDIARFSPISIVLAYTNAEDTTPAFYFLESGSAQGNAAALYYAPDIGSDIHTQADFRFSPMACKTNWYAGGLSMDAQGVEPTQVYNKVAQNKDGARTYLHLAADYTVIQPDTVAWPVSAQIEATLRVFALARGMGGEVLGDGFILDEVEEALARCALEILDWDVEPPTSGTAEGYFGCPGK